MSEHSDPATNEANQAASISNRRLLIEMAVIIAIGTILGFFAVSLKFAVGVLIGGGLAFLNYFWLRRVLRSAFESAVAGGMPGWLIGSHYLRFAVTGLVLFAIYLTDAASVVGAVFGLASFSLAVVFAGIINIFSGLFKKEF
jgi:hypothetical protein